MPLNGRSFQSLITLTPGVVVVPSFRNSTGQFSVNGQRANANYFTVDGVSANIANGVGNNIGQSTSGTLPGLTAFGTTQSLVSVDALQEFQVQTSSYSAEFGRSPGAQVSIVTRSGTNDFHGTAFDYVRNDKFDANNWFSNAFRIKRQPERQNDFGGTFSGPIMLPRFGEGGRQPGYNGRNRTFLFFSYEGLRLRTPQFALTASPSLSFRQTAPAALQPLLNGFPTPNGPAVGGGFSQLAAGYSNPSTLNATSIRIDHTVDQKLTLFGRFNNAPSRAATRAGGSNPSLINFTAIHTKTLTLGATMMFAPTIGNELRVNYSDNIGTAGLEQDAFGGAVPVPRELVLPARYAPAGSAASVTISFSYPGGGTSLGYDNRLQSQRQFNIVDNTSVAFGTHQLKFGADYRRLMPVLEPEVYQLFVSFGSQAEVNNNAASFVSISARKGAKPIYTNFSAYAQDTWKLSRRLTIDLGLRWEVNPSPREANGNDPYTAMGVDNLATATLAPQGTPLWKTTYGNFAPRFGAAYLLRQTSGRETVVRGGLGIFYDTGNGQGSNGFLGFPFSASRSVFTGVGFPLDAVQVAPPTFNLSPPYQEIYSFDPHLKLPYTLQWNIAIEQSFGKSQTVTASYVGNAGRRLLLQRTLSPRASGINPNFVFIYPTSNGATSDYDALQVQFQSRLARGLQALASYTWSHAIDTVSQDSKFQPNAFALLRGNSEFDIRHNFTAAVTYDIPALHGNTVARALLSDWSVDTRVYAQSALPLEITRGTIRAPDGSSVPVRVNLLAGVPLYLKDSTVPGGRKINNAAFSAPLAGQLGNLGRNVVRGFGAWQIDMALRRQFNLGEKLKLQMRAEAFNVLNHPNFGSVNTSLTSSTFGQATNMLGSQLGGLSALYQIGGPRSFQFALKLMF
jgi:hypothetical protein